MIIGSAVVALALLLGAPAFAQGDTEARRFCMNAMLTEANQGIWTENHDAFCADYATVVQVQNETVETLAKATETIGRLEATLARQSAVIEGLAQRLNAEEARSTSLAARSLPDRALLAIDSAEGCPAGWTNVGLHEAERFAGRFLLTAGPTVERETLSTVKRALDDQGGTETHQLIEAEMPRHTHRPPAEALRIWWHVPGNGNHDIVNAYDGGKNHENWYSNVHHPTVAHAGDNQPHNNMPPFIALHLCRLDT